MASSTVWWLMTGAAIVLELISGTGTVYLLLIGAGFAAAAVTAHLGASLGAQFIAAAVVSVSAVIVWHAIRRRRPPGPPTSANPDVNLDIGERVQVDAWNADGTAIVRYRGAQWTAVARAGDVPAAGQHKVVEVVGSRLVVEKI
ncbi:NfeD family protein [Variovorax sp. Sphag1AA]|uniref:NfeD family protein n=1 Tax=Variovorax sp. Sphag1AA TaxID=2587027 RepID=UPI00161FDB1D|nr:NfeD family protein [Variovorax sp. Sphag1AA]MBB3176280.1 membrane protein implicated in regulation of membrane protease activity [Variovorax sp. Sphag1AA]